MLSTALPTLLTPVAAVVNLSATSSLRETRGPREEPALRADGRAADDLRPVKIIPDFIPNAEGSVLIEEGNTRVIVTATIEDGVPSFRKGSGKGWVTGENSTARGAALGRRAQGWCGKEKSTPETLTTVCQAAFWLARS